MNTQKSSSLQQFQARVAIYPELRTCILEASIYNKTLVVLCGCDLKISSIKSMLRRHWDGKIEVYRPRDLMAGSISKTMAGLRTALQNTCNNNTQAKRGC